MTTPTHNILLVRFYLPVDDPAANPDELQKELQETLYDRGGMAGGFKIIDEYLATPSLTNRLSPLRDTPSVNPISAIDSDVMAHIQHHENVPEPSPFAKKIAENPEIHGIEPPPEHIEQMIGEIEKLGEPNTAVFQRYDGQCVMYRQATPAEQLLAKLLYELTMKGRGLPLSMTNQDVANWLDKQLAIKGFRGNPQGFEWNHLEWVSKSNDLED